MKAGLFANHWCAVVNDALADRNRSDEALSDGWMPAEEAGGLPIRHLRADSVRDVIDRRYRFDANIRRSFFLFHSPSRNGNSFALSMVYREVLVLSIRDMDNLLQKG